ncbi:MAG: RHS repeat domain-containing protein [Weeksellaceae bacterium]
MKYYKGIFNKTTYLYNAQGIKRGKIIMEQGRRSITDYLSAFQYKDGALAYIQHAEGYINVEQRSKIDDLPDLPPNFPINPGFPTDPRFPILRFNQTSVKDVGAVRPIYDGGGLETSDEFHYEFAYVYHYIDHLGNIRLSYSDKNQDGKFSDYPNEIIDENNYYPFGLELEGVMGKKVNISINNGKELQDEMGLNFYDMDMRQYDPALGRWMVLDPLIHHSMSPYNAFDNNPIVFADPSGADATKLVNRMVERSEDGDTWVNNGDGTFSNSRTGEAMECLDCPPASGGPFAGTILQEGVSYDKTNKYILWHSNERVITMYSGNEEIAERLENLINHLGSLEEILDELMKAQVILGLGGITAKGVLKYGNSFNSIIKHIKGRTLVMTAISVYLKHETSELSETQKNLGAIAMRILRNYNPNMSFFELTEMESGYIGVDSKVTKAFYYKNGSFNGGYERNMISTIQYINE